MNRWVARRVRTRYSSRDSEIVDVMSVSAPVRCEMVAAMDVESIDAESIDAESIDVEAIAAGLRET